MLTYDMKGWIDYISPHHHPYHSIFYPSERWPSWNGPYKTVILDFAAHGAVTTNQLVLLLYKHCQEMEKNHKNK